jgi:hypothetical protein
MIIQPNNGVYAPTEIIPREKIPLPIGLPTRPGRDSSVGHDIALDPFHDRNRERVQRGGEPLIGFLIPAETMLLREQFYAAALTPKGRYITWVSPKSAFHKGWLFVQEKRKKNQLPTRLRNHLINLTNDHDLKLHFTVAKSIAMIFGRSLQFKREVATAGNRSRIEIREIQIFDEWIEYDEAGIPKKYNPVIRIGKEMRQIEIPAKDAVLWIHNLDPFGNGYQGVSEILPVFKTIKRSESIAQNFAEIISQRGLGQLDIEIEDIVDQNDANKWANTYRDLVQESIIVHSPDMKTTVTPGVNAGFNYSATQQTYYEDTAAGTGNPQMRMRGVQGGAVKGAETDQDNAAEVYAGIQESSEPYMKAFYRILDPGLAGTQFEIDWRFDIKMDVQKKAQVLATNVNTVLAGAEIFSLGNAEEIMDVVLPIEEPDREKLVQEYIDEHFEVEEMSVEGNPNDKGNNPGDKGNSDVTTKAINKQQNNPGGRGNNNFGTTNTDSNTNSNTDSINVDSWTREDWARLLLKEGVGLRPVNDFLKKKFGEGFGNQKLMQLRDE